jgi:hypothetical protein
MQPVQWKTPNLNDPDGKPVRHNGVLFQVVFVPDTIENPPVQSGYMGMVRNTMTGKYEVVPLSELVYMG